MFERLIAAIETKLTSENAEAIADQMITSAKAGDSSAILALAILVGGNGLQVTKPSTEPKPSEPTAKTISTLTTQFKNLYTTREAAEKLGVHQRTIEALVSHQQIRVIRIGRSVRFDDKCLSEYVESHKQKVTLSKPITLQVSPMRRPRR